jgi:hypothetical protein
MARKRAPKKDELTGETPIDEATSQDTSEPERVTVVTEVVEMDTPEDATSASKAEEMDEGPEVVTSVASPEPLARMDEPPKEEKQKDVVEGLFRRDTPPVSPEITIHKENKRLPLGLWIAIVVVVAALVGGGLLWATTGSGGGLKLPSMAKATPTPTGTPAPTPTPAISRADITIQVLNGGGTPGAAGRMKSFLEEKGYTVSDTGNTEEYTYKTIDILSKPDKEAYLALLQTDLASDFTLGSVSATLASDFDYDVQVIVGEGE